MRRAVPDPAQRGSGVFGMRPTLAAATQENGASYTMTEAQFNEIVARQEQPPLGTSSQVKTDIGALISEITRRTAAGDAAFEPEPGESVAGEDPDITIARSGAARPTSGARKK
jgi:hypothetical protein